MGDSQAGGASDRSALTSDIVSTHTSAWHAHMRKVRKQARIEAEKERAMERACGSSSQGGGGGSSSNPPPPPRGRPAKPSAPQRPADGTVASQATAASQTTANLGWRSRPVSRSRDALQRVGTSAPIYAALAERLSSIEGASQSGDGLSRRRGLGGGPRHAAARPLVAGQGQAASAASASRPQARAAALADVRAAVRERKELQQRQQQEEELPDQPQPEQQPGSTSSRASSPVASHRPTHQLQRATLSSSPLAGHEPPAASRLSKEAPMEHAARAIEALESICPLGCDPLDAATIFFGGASLTASALRKRLGLLEAPPLKYSMLERKPLMVRYGLAVEAARAALGEGSKLLRTAPQSLAGLAMERELVMGELTRLEAGSLAPPTGVARDPTVASGCPDRERGGARGNVGFSSAGNAGGAAGSASGAGGASAFLVPAGARSASAQEAPRKKAAQGSTVRGSGGAGGAGGSAVGGGISGSSGAAAEEALEKKRRDAEKVKAAITAVKVKAVKDMEKEQKAAKAVKDMEKEHKEVTASQVSRGRSRSSGFRPTGASSTAGSSHNGGGGGGGGDRPGSPARPVPSTSPDGSGGGPSRTESLMDRLGAKGWLPVGAPSSGCLAGALSSSPGIRAALAAAMREPSAVDYSWRSSEADTEYTSGLFSQRPTDRFTTGLSGLQPAASDANSMDNVRAVLTMKLQIPPVRRPSPPRGVGPSAAGTSGWLDADLLRRPEPHLLRRASLEENYASLADLSSLHPGGGTRGQPSPPLPAQAQAPRQRGGGASLDGRGRGASRDQRGPSPERSGASPERRANDDELSVDPDALTSPSHSASSRESWLHDDGDLSREQREAIAEFMHDEQRALDARDLFAAYDELDAIYQATPVGTQREQPTGIGKDDGLPPIRRHDDCWALPIGAPDPSHRSAASSHRSRVSFSPATRAVERVKQPLIGRGLNPTRLDRGGGLVVDEAEALRHAAGNKPAPVPPEATSAAAAAKGARHGHEKGSGASGALSERSKAAGKSVSQVRTHNAPAGGDGGRKATKSGGGH